MNYNTQAQQFAEMHKVKLKINAINYGKHFADENFERYVFNCTISRNRKRYTFNFGQSIANGNQEPTMYDLLTCFTKYDPETFANFCAEYGYSEDSITALKTYKAVSKEYKAIIRLFGDIMEELQEIQ